MEELRIETAQYIRELRELAKAPSLSALRGHFDRYADTLDEWRRCYAGAVEDVREAERRIQQLGGTTLDGVKHGDKNDEQ
jgi:hypothetical protein